MGLPRICLAASAVVLLLIDSRNVSAEDLDFSRAISRPVLENYLARSITMLDLLAGKGDFTDNLRMLRKIGARFCGRTIYLWGYEDRLPELLDVARPNARRLRAADEKMILQAAVFEIVTRDVEKLPVPDWAYDGVSEVPRQRHFSYEAMLHPDGFGRDRWWPGASVPDISRPETKLWFFYLAATYIDLGCEAIHFGQSELMAGNDPDRLHWDELLARVRRYAATRARRRLVLCDAHVPSGGMRRGERLLFDFHSFPLRIVEVLDKPQHGELQMGAFDSIYGRSRGGIAPSGWRCDHLPYLVELDNWGASDRPGQPTPGTCWVWGYDEISWFAHQDKGYRDRWLHYAWNWIRRHDKNGYLQMPGSRILHAPVGGRHWYYANAPSSAVPHGFDQEDAIADLWDAVR